MARETEYHYYMFNKPFGCVTARRDALYPTVMDYFRELGNPSLSPVGRLDRETEGLLLVTDDGKWNMRLTDPEYHSPKTYEFTVLGHLDRTGCELLEGGVDLPQTGRTTAPAAVEITGYSVLRECMRDIHPETAEKIRRNLPDTPVTFGRITITEGKKHQVRKMMKCAGCYVIALRRIAMGGFRLDETLRPGQWKEIKTGE